MITVEVMPLFRYCRWLSREERYTVPMAVLEAKDDTGNGVRIVMTTDEFDGIFENRPWKPRP